MHREQINVIPKSKLPGRQLQTSVQQKHYSHGTCKTSFQKRRFDPMGDIKKNMYVRTPRKQGFFTYLPHWILGDSWVHGDSSLIHKREKIIQILEHLINKLY